MRALFCVLGVGLAGCPPPPQLEGSQCDSQGQCPRGLVCFHDRCRVERCDPEELGLACSAGTGGCARTGVIECVAGDQGCSASPGAPLDEVCNGVDDDCNGAIDDAVRDAGDACFGGLGACAGDGVTVCVDAGFVCKSAREPVAELCENGVDDDCDGFPDDGCLLTIAGDGPPGDRDGTWAEATLRRPQFLASDPAGNVFVADSSNNKVRVIRADGGVSTVAGSGACGAVDGPAASASFCQPWGVDVAPTGELYVSDLRNRRIRVVRQPLGTATVESRWFADAGLVAPRGVRFTADGGLLIADTSANRLFFATSRSVVPVGGLALPLSGPSDAIESDDGAGFYVCEQTGNRIRYVSRSGTSSAVLAGDLAGTAGTANGIASAARFDGPSQLVLDSDAGRLIVADTNNNRLRAVPLEPLTATSNWFTGLSGPAGITRVGDSIAVAEQTTHWVRRVAASSDGGLVLQGMVSGSAIEPIRDGAALSARLQSPDRLVLWPRNGLAWADAAAVRLMIPDAGRVLTLAGPPTVAGSNPDGPLFNGGWLALPGDVKPGPDGALYITDLGNRVVRRIDPGATRIETFAGPDGGAPITTSFVSPALLAFSTGPDGEDFMFVVDGTQSPLAWRLRRFDMMTGVETVLAATDAGGLSAPSALAGGTEGDVYLLDADLFMRRFAVDGGVTRVLRMGGNTAVRGFVLDGRGNALWARTRQVLRGNFDAGTVEVLYESLLYPPPNPAAIAGLADGPSDAGIIWSGTSVALDGERLYLTDEANNRLRRLLLPR
ncbi:MAG: hypothetical protein JNK82_30460 [Myxococcaceae bacterium]|nr:hypothetical protein [Myxococcaceae bacterium]